MTHKTAQEVGRDINEAVAPSRPAEKKTEKQPTEYTFKVDWLSPQRKRYHGGFSAHIMDAKDMIAVGVLRSTLCGGVMPESLDGGTYNTAVMISTLQVVLDESPEWAKDLVGIREIDLIGEIYKEVKLREDRFCGRATQEGQGAAGD